MTANEYMYSGVNPTYRSLYRIEKPGPDSMRNANAAVRGELELRAVAATHVAAMMVVGALVAMSPALRPAQRPTADSHRATSASISSRAAALRSEIEARLARMGATASVFTTDGDEGDEFVEAAAPGRRLTVRLHPGNAGSWAVVTANGHVGYGDLATLDVGAMLEAFSR